MHLLSPYIRSLGVIIVWWTHISIYSRPYFPFTLAFWASWIMVQDKDDVQHQISILLFIGLACGIVMFIFTRLFGTWGITGKYLILFCGGFINYSICVVFRISSSSFSSGVFFRRNWWYICLTFSFHRGKQYGNNKRSKYLCPGYYAIYYWCMFSNTNWIYLFFLSFKKHLIKSRKTLNTM